MNAPVPGMGSVRLRLAACGAAGGGGGGGRAPARGLC